MPKRRATGLPRPVLYPLAAIGTVLVICLAPVIAETVEEIVEHGTNLLRKRRKGK